LAGQGQPDLAGVGETKVAGDIRVSGAKFRSVPADWC
jgi:hypothetical protein